MRNRSILLTVLLGLAVISCGSDESTTSSGTVTVEITGLDDFVGSEVAAVMYDSLGVDRPDSRAVGGFGAVVSSEASTVTGIITIPSEKDGTPFPFVSDEPLIVEPGEYTIMLWLDDQLGQYSRWVPGDLEGSMELRGCRVDIEVHEGQPTEVSVASVPVWPGFGPTAPTCTTK